MFQLSRNYLIFGTEYGAKFEKPELHEAFISFSNEFSKLFDTKNAIIGQILEDFYEEVGFMTFSNAL